MASALCLHDKGLYVIILKNSSTLTMTPTDKTEAFLWIWMAVLTNNNGRKASIP
jgi:hypothetical protein